MHYGKATNKYQFLPETLEDLRDFAWADFLPLWGFLDLFAKHLPLKA